MGLELEVGPEALIPRQETEILCTAALELLHALVLEHKEARVLDLCAGAGNIATALAHYEPHCRIWAADLCPRALQLARRNAERNQLDGRVQFFDGDLFRPFAGGGFERHFDLIVCNPPYISTTKVGDLPAEIGQHEPRLAFDGGPFGLSVITRVIQESPQYLKPASWLCFEVGLGQGDFLYRGLMKNPAYVEVRRLLDHRNEVRALAARTKA
jgi:release factor glutamine methyltransferase